MNLTYEKCGDYLIPNIIPDPEPGEELRKFGLMRKNYLKEYKSGIYQGMVLSGKLKEHLLMVQEQAELGSIRELLRLGHVEDVFIILRTSFEGYIASRYIDEEYNTDILNDFIFIPQLIAARKIIYQNGKAVERGTQEIIWQKL